jgi:hypothetical protein
MLQSDRHMYSFLFEMQFSHVSRLCGQWHAGSALQVVSAPVKADRDLQYLGVCRAVKVPRYVYLPICCHRRHTQVTIARVKVSSEERNRNSNLASSIARLFDP